MPEREDTEGRINVRNVDPAIWRRIRAAAVEDGIPLGQLVTQIFRGWLEAREKQAR